jgi:hypothetical protein
VEPLAFLIGGSAATHNMPNDGGKKICKNRDTSMK